MQRIILVAAVVAFVVAGSLFFMTWRGTNHETEVDRTKSTSATASDQTTTKAPDQTTTLTEQIKALKEKNQELSLQNESYAHRLAALEEELNQAREKLAESQDQKLKIAKQQLATVINFSDEVLFEAGQTTVTEAGLKVLKEVADELKAKPEFRISIEGHTDDTALSQPNQEKYGDNLGVSVARALAVARELIKYGVPPEKTSVTGFGSQRPLASNSTAQGRAKNRRVEIRLIPIED